MKAATKQKEQITSNMVDGKFSLSKEPIDYVISVHICNMRNTPNLNAYSKSLIMSNLYATYGYNKVTSVLKEFFPKMVQSA